MPAHHQAAARAEMPHPHTDDRATVRLFVSLPVPENIGRTIKFRTSDLRGSLHEVRWEPLEKFHVTLRFLGETRRPRVPEILSAIQHRCRGRCSFRLKILGVEVLQRRRYPQVLMLAVERDAALSVLKQAVDDGLEAAGIAPDPRDFLPHITIARCRRRMNLPELPRFELVFSADRVALVQSRLRREGALHQEVGQAALAPEA